MRKFEIGNRIISTQNLDLCANRYHYKQAVHVESVQSATDEFFSQGDIDLNGMICGMNSYLKCNQIDGKNWGTNNAKYLNLDLDPKSALDYIDKEFDRTLTKDRVDSDTEITKLEAQVKRLNDEIENLKKESKNEALLKTMKAYVLKGLGLESGEQ